MKILTGFFFFSASTFFGLTALNFSNLLQSAEQPAGVHLSSDELLKAQNRNLAELNRAMAYCERTPGHNPQTDECANHLLALLDNQ